MKLRNLSFGAVLFFAPASADMGQIHVETQGVSVSESAQKAIILVNGSEEVLILGTELKASKPTPVVRFIPFPAEPKVAVAPKGAFEAMARLVAKYRLQYVTTWQSKGGPEKVERDGVEVRFAAKMGGHDLTVIRVTNAKAVRSWVNAYFKKKHLPIAASYAGAEKVIADYVARGIDWFVLDAVELSPASQAIEPIAYSFASKALYYPLKNTNTFGGTGEVELFVIAPTTLCAPGASGFLDTGDWALDAAGKHAGPCFGLKAKASTSALLVPEEHDVAAIWPEDFFAGKPAYLQAIRYAGPFKFDADVMISLPNGIAEALGAPEEGGNPFLDQLVPEEHKLCRALPDRGPCKGLFEGWYFDQKSRSCKSFVWGGCQGNVPFKTEDECKKRCTMGK